MDKPTDLSKFRNQKRRERGRTTTLCRNGHHKWGFDANKQFDVKRGQLVSVQRCVRCGATRTRVS